MAEQEVLTITAPATSANLGPGFDVLALAIDLANEVLIVRREGPLAVHVEGEGADEVPANADNLFCRALASGIGSLDGLEITCRNRIPFGRGLGSSAAAVCAGLVAANALGHLRWSPSDILARAIEFEGHGDNAAACLDGGITVAGFKEIDLRPQAATLIQSCIADVGSFLSTLGGNTQAQVAPAGQTPLAPAGAIQRDGIGPAPASHSFTPDMASGGSRMPAEVQSRMESSFGSDFSGVRVHTDGAAAGLSSGLNARAFTYGSHIFFGAGQYSPGSQGGDQLLAFKCRIHCSGHFGEQMDQTGFLGGINPALGLAQCDGKGGEHGHLAGEGLGGSHAHFRAGMGGQQQLGFARHR
jgi:hypothetical protein